MAETVDVLGSSLPRRIWNIPFVVPNALRIPYAKKKKNRTPVKREEWTFVHMEPTRNG